MSTPNAIAPRIGPRTAAVAVSGTPSSGQVLTATGANAATWQTPSGGSSPSVAVGSNTTQSLSNGASYTESISVGTGKTACIAWLKENGANANNTEDRGCVVVATATASQAKSAKIQGGGSGLYSGNSFLSGFTFGGGSIHLESATYNGGTGNLDLVFKNSSGGNATQNCHWTILGF